jgi:hypothetical protein
MKTLRQGYPFHRRKHYLGSVSLYIVNERKSLDTAMNSDPCTGGMGEAVKARTCMVNVCGGKQRSGARIPS